VANSTSEPGNEPSLDAAGSWAKDYFLASRTVMEAVLRPYDLGNTQWYVLGRLANDGPTKQRDLLLALGIERATLSGVIAALVRKGLVEQMPDPVDQRQKTLKITPTGRDLWESLPDPVAIIATVAFDGVDPTDIATASRVLKKATARLNDYKRTGSKT
jgi:DNA-binding MarR family transcriptional regulator